ncbi:uncharacterized protein MELLADRAFT_84890 [Melampsora larici-populina 98AG31]|uniref:Uncharacterized protein n=1 Tax=Melampsora larici-populina (strain 98AG31 / pathotype 3-4-7) TaxID=747676 RepID=F4RH50_MELLP|nr:uncharacterized protein MELLADRAFT_84890 [Melampsora larici-populina 98AG31]EGG08136.1 hypothetical protein MELLADRAFT_84890 [Melampsora larici-populina 98AG31]
MQIVIGESGKREMCNAGALQEDLLRAAKDKAESAGERNFTENPYATGQKTMDSHVQAQSTTSAEKRQFAASNHVKRETSGPRGGNETGWRGRGRRPNRGNWPNRGSYQSHYGASHSTHYVPGGYGAYPPNQHHQPYAPTAYQQHRGYGYPHNNTNGYTTNWPDQSHSGAYTPNATMGEGGSQGGAGGKTYGGSGGGKGSAAGKSTQLQLFHRRYP